MKPNWKKTTFPFLLTLALCACGETPAPSSSPASSEASSASAPVEGISLYDNKSIVVGTAKANPDVPGTLLPEFKDNILTAPLSTYRLGGKGDVPYVDVAQFAQAMNTALPVIIRPGQTTEIKTDGIHLYALDKKGEIVLNAETDQVKIKNSQAFCYDATIDNNGIPGDYCIFRGNTIRESEKTKVYREDGSAVPEYETYDFKKYGFDIVQKDGKYYAPFEMLSKIVFRDVGIDLAYNGKEFYLNQLSNFARTRVMSSKGYWMSALAAYKPSAKEAGEAYRFEYTFQAPKGENPEETETRTKFFICQEGADGNCVVTVCRGTSYDPAQTVPDETESNYSYKWRKEGDLLIIRVSEGGNETGDYCIHLDETTFNRKTITKEFSDYNYNVLRFLFDNIYGLKDIKGYTDAEAYFASAGVKDDLKSTDISKYNNALAKLIGYVDDCHTSYTGLSPYTAYEDVGTLNSIMSKNIGPRLAGLSSKQKQYAKARVDKYAELNPTDPMAGNTDASYYQGLGLSSDKQTAVITFDGFQHSSSEIQSMGAKFGPDYDIDEDNYRIVTRSNMIFSSPDGFSAAFAILKHINKNANVVKNVVVDLTVNGGGMIAVVPYLAAFFTDDPCFVVKDTLNKTVREYHYKIDLNGDGTYGGEGDTFKGKFNFYFLTSGFSFSCGNCLPGLAKNAGAKIIGEQSGGGTSPVGVYLDALGSGINLSHYYNMSYKGTDGKYTQNDAGIPLDHAFPLENGNWYDPNAIQTFINSLQ